MMKRLYCISPTIQSHVFGFCERKEMQNNRMNGRSCRGIECSDTRNFLHRFSLPLVVVTIDWEEIKKRKTNSKYRSHPHHRKWLPVIYSEVFFGVSQLFVTSTEISLRWCLLTCSTCSSLHITISVGWLNTLEQVTVNSFVSNRRFRPVPPCIGYCFILNASAVTIQTAAPIRSAGKYINFTIEIFTQNSS